MTEQFKELHERAKEHIFWKTFNQEYAEDACKTLYNLERAIVGYFYGLGEERKKNAQWVVVDFICHNVNSLMLHIRGKTSKLEGENIIILQSFLQNLHLLVDDMVPEDPCGLEPYGFYDGEYRKIKTALNEDGITYRPVQVIKSSQVPETIKNLNEHITWYNGDDDMCRKIREEYQEEIDLLNNEQKLTKWFKIED